MSHILGLGSQQEWEWEGAECSGVILGCSGRGFTTENGSDQFLAVLYGLQVLLLALLGLVLLLQVGLDGFVLGIEVTQVLGQENTGNWLWS